QAYAVIERKIERPPDGFLRVPKRDRAPRRHCSRRCIHGTPEGAGPDDLGDETPPEGLSSLEPLPEQQERRRPTHPNDTRQALGQTAAWQPALSEIGRRQDCPRGCDP